MFLSRSNFTMYNTDNDTVTVLSGTNGNDKGEGTNGLVIDRSFGILHCHRCDAICGFLSASSSCIN